jgi:biotin carboxyl carrier protein
MGVREDLALAVGHRAYALIRIRLFPVGERAGIMGERLFRKVAIERQSSPEQLDVLMQVTSPKGWVFLAAMGGLLLCAVIWGCLGYIPVKVNGQGMLMRTGGVYEIVSGSSGEVKGLYFEPGEVIEKGRTVARVDQSELLGRIREASASLKELRVGRDRMASEAATAQELRSLDERVRQAERSLQALQNDFDASSRVTSPFTGRVLELTIRIGEIVAKGTPLMRIELVGTEIGSMQAVMYFPAGSGEKIRQGMAAQIAPLVVERSEYGFLQGLVTRVSDYPSSREGMMRMLQNEALVQALSKEGAPIEVYADLIPDPVTPSGYKWSSSKGPDIKLQTGTICLASVTVSKQRPISLLIPLLKKRLLGIG